MVGEPSGRLLSPKKPGVLLDLGWSAVTPLLFAAFAVFAGRVVPDPGPDGAITPELQTTAIILGLTCLTSTSLVALLVIAPSRSLRQQLFSLFYRDMRDVAWLNVWSFLGLPLWIAAIALIGAAPANWIDMGLAPVFTFALALFAPIRSERPNSWFALLGAAFSFAAVVLVTTYSLTLTLSLLGIVIAVVSSWGTVGASGVISSLQRRGNAEGALKRGPIVLMFARNLLAIAVLATALPLLSSGQEISASLSTTMQPEYFAGVVLLWILPNFLFISFLKKRALVFSAVMWAFLPVFTSLLAFGQHIGEIGIDAIVAAPATTVAQAFEQTGVPWYALAGATACLVVSFWLLDLGQQAQKRRQQLTDATAVAPA